MVGRAAGEIEDLKGPERIFSSNLLQLGIVSMNTARRETATLNVHVLATGPVPHPIAHARHDSQSRATVRCTDFDSGESRVTALYCT